MRVGFIGCGTIAYAHADVVSHLGHEIVSVAYQQNTENAKKFAKSYDVKGLFPGSDWRGMIEEASPDILWVVPSWDQIDQMFQEVVSTGIPAFFEKPLALDDSKIENLIVSHTTEELSKYMVGYNRRFYSNIDTLKKYLEKEKIISVYVNIPEPVDRRQEYRLRHAVIENSCHVLDLVSFVLGSYNYDSLSIRPVTRSLPGRDYIATYELDSVPVVVKSIWNSPENFEVSIYAESDRAYRLSPIEKLTVLDGLDVKEPTEEVPIRSYNPCVVDTHYVSAKRFKPGFEAQAASFFERIENGELISPDYFKEIRNLTRLCRKLSRL
jgi:predicted dehydrogenase